jgi:nucleoside-diphosphate-sugar epimerase
MEKALVCGAGGFIGSHLVQRLKAEGYRVRGADLKYPEFSKSPTSHTMKFTSWRRTWAGRDSCFQARTTPISCITPP